MTHKARIRPGYRARPALIALLLIGYGLWAVWDGFYAYPHDNHQYEQYQQFLEQREIESVAAARDQWIAYTEKHNLPEDTNEFEYHGTTDMYLQYGLVVFCLPLGLLAAGAAIRCGWLWVGSDDRGLHASKGQFAAWDRIQSVDKSRWPRKGIAIVHYTDDSGNTRRLTLDDWKYETEPVRQMLRQVEDQLGEPHIDDEPLTGEQAPSESHSPDQTQDEHAGEPTRTN